MRISFTTILLLWLSNISFGQHILSGEYDFGLKLAYDSHTKKLTGFFENYTGWDEESNSPRFSCILYIEGTVTKNKFSIQTYYPESKSDEIITGLFEIVNDSTIKIKLPSEHGGCWNVQHFADEPVRFNIEKKQEWTQIKYVAADKAYFYAEKSETQKQKSYLIKNDFVCISNIENDWAYCTYFGKRITKGWIKTSDLNQY